MEKIKIETSFNIELEFELADVLKRFLGWLIDAVVQTVYVVLAFKLLDVVTTGKPHPNDLSAAYDSRAWSYIIFIPVFLYHLVSEILLNGQSLGKKIVGIRVISETGNRPSFYQFLIRWLMRPIDTYFFLIPAFVSILVSKKNQRLGDLAAGTYVIVSRVKSDINDTVFFQLEDSYQPRYENVLQLSDRDMNIIKTILDTSVKQKNFELAERTSAKVRTALKITDYQHPFEFLETVLKDYNYLSNKN